MRLLIALTFCITPAMIIPITRHVILTVISTLF